MDRRYCVPNKTIVLSILNSTTVLKEDQMVILEENGEWSSRVI